MNFVQNNKRKIVEEFVRIIYHRQNLKTFKNNKRQNKLKLPYVSQTQILFLT